MYVMRLVSTLMWLSSGLTVAAAAGKPTQTTLVSFETSAGSRCTASIQEAILPSTEPNEKLKVLCDNQDILTYDLRDAGIQSLTPSHDGSGRIEVLWERGTGAGITIFQVRSADGKPSAKKVLEHFTATGGESFENQNIVFVNVGKRFVGSEILSAATNVYKWRDGAYVFVAAYRWNPSASYRDRYCILLPSAKCPAVISSVPIPEKF